MGTLYRNKSIRAMLCIALTITFAISGCKVDQSKLKVVNGKEITENDFPHVVQVMAPNGLMSPTCSSTWVSDSTLITAAHCLETDSGRMLSNAVISRGVGKGAKSTKVIIHPKYKGTRYDVAIILFPAGTSTAHVGIAKEAPKVGDQITIVGFGKFDHADGKSGGKKRFGTNKVVEFDASRRIVFDGHFSPPSGEGTGESVTNSQGDSGGPMFFEDSIIGISSTVNSIPTADKKLRGNYENLRYDEIQAFLEEAVEKHGAKIRGLHDTDNKPTSTSPTIAGGAGAAKIDLPVSFTKTTTATLPEMLISCEACEKIDLIITAKDGTKATQPTKKIDNIGSRAAFQALPLQNAETASIEIQALDKDGKALAKRKIQLKAKKP